MCGRVRMIRPAVFEELQTDQFGGSRKKEE